VSQPDSPWVKLKKGKLNPTHLFGEPESLQPGAIHHELVG